MRSMTRLVLAGLATMAFASIAGAQQSVRAPNDSVVPQLTRAQLQEAREAYAMKCLTGQALATRIASSGEMAPEPSKVKNAGGKALGLGGLDASQGLVQPQHAPHFDPQALADSRRGSNVSRAMMARNESTVGRGIPCQAPPIKTPRPQ